MAAIAPNEKVIVVLPAYNAEKTLERTLAAIPADSYDEVILVDDASRDGTVALSRKLGLPTFVHEVNRGYGANQKTCYREALKRGGTIMVMLHPDFQYHPKYVPDLVRLIASGGCEAAFGSRMIKKEDAKAGGMPWWKFLFNILLTWVGNLSAGLRLTEWHCGLRAYSRTALEAVDFEKNSDGFVFDTEILLQCAAAGVKIKETPIITIYHDEASSIPFRACVPYTVAILKSCGRYLLHRLHLPRSKRYTPLRKLR